MDSPDVLGWAVESGRGQISRMHGANAGTRGATPIRSEILGSRARERLGGAGKARQRSEKKKKKKGLFRGAPF